MVICSNKENFTTGINLQSKIVEKNDHILLIFAYKYATVKRAKYIERTTQNAFTVCIRSIFLHFSERYPLPPTFFHGKGFSGIFLSKNLHNDFQPCFKSKIKSLFLGAFCKNKISVSEYEALNAQITLNQI